MAQATTTGPRRVAMDDADVLWPPEVARPGGDPLTRELLHGAGVDASARVVQLAPGTGATVRRVLEVGPRTFLAVAPGTTTARLLGRVAPAAEVVTAPADATGLDDGAASAVIAEGLLTCAAPEARAALVTEAARLLRAGGRLGLHELCLWPGDAPEETATVARALADAGVHPLDPDEWRAVLSAGGLVPVGATTGAPVARSNADLFRELGPRGALGALEALGRDHRAARRTIAARTAVDRYRRGLAAIVVIGEKPLIAGIRRPSVA